MILHQTLVAEWLNPCMPICDQISGSNPTGNSICFTCEKAVNGLESASYSNTGAKSG